MPYFGDHQVVVKEVNSEIDFTLDEIGRRCIFSKRLEVAAFESKSVHRPAKLLLPVRRPRA
jgi:hypothetical protein